MATGGVRMGSTIMIRMEGAKDIIRMEEPERKMAERDQISDQD